MEISAMQDLLGEYLPKELNIDRYDLEKIEKDDDLKKYHPFLGYRGIYLVEKNIRPAGFENNKNVVSKGFYDSKTLMEVPVRCRLGRIFIKKRKWYDQVNKKVISSDDIEYQGSKALEDFIFFCRT
jgi:hypothetical protein